MVWVANRDDGIQEPVTFEQAVDMLLAEMRRVLLAKQADYGPGNIAKFGELGVLVRASDKVERLTNLLQSGREPNHESLDDSWLDLANYGLIGLLVRRGLWGLPMEQAAVYKPCATCGETPAWCGCEEASRSD